MTDSAAEEAGLDRWLVWTPSGSVTPREYLAGKPAADQVMSKLVLMLGKLERYGVVARAFADYLGVDLDALYAERHPRRGAALVAKYRARGEHPHAPAGRRAAPPAAEGAPQAMTDGKTADGHGERPAEPAREHPESRTRGERRRHALSPEMAAVLRAARGRLHLSVRQAAGRLDLAVGMVSMLESGTRAPSLQVAERLVDVYQLDDAEAVQLLAEAVPGTGRDYRR